jgi:hypothetical protein
VQETIGTLLAERLGVRASSIRLIPTQSKEGNLAIRTFKKFNPQAAIDIKKFKHFTIQQYLPGCSLLGDDGKTIDTTEKLHKSLHDVFNRDVSCNSIGRIMAFDMLINMWDRIPLIWDNDGNDGNLFVHNRKMYAIDNIAGAILDQEKAEEYQKKIEHLIEKVSECDRKNTMEGDPLCDTVRTFVNSRTSRIGFEISDESLIKIRKGFIDALDDWTSDDAEFIKVIDGVWNDINDMLNRGTKNEEDSLENYSTDKSFFVNNYHAMHRAYLKTTLEIKD